MNIATISRDLRRQKQAEFELRRLNDSLECRIENCTTALVAEVAQRKRADARSQKLQFTLSHAGRLSTAGQMAGAIAHEMSQPLTAVANSANAARRLLTQAGHERIDTIQEILDEIAGQSLRAGQILRRLRDFVIRGEGEKQVEDLEALVRDASVFARIGVETLDVELRFDFDPTASFVFANRIQIQQVLVNLLRNALEAMVGMKRPQLLVSTLRLDDAIEIAVVDNGPGLPEEIVQHLFEPFVSTKSDGMGFGLAICRSIVEAHNGVLHLEPNPAGGSVFRFTLPFATEARQDHARQEHDLRCSGESTIYVVDDDAAVLRSLERLLGAAGYETMSFEQPVALLEAVSQLSEGCILLDVRMPGLNGLEVQAALAKLDCRLPVIVMTGQGDVPTAVRAMKAGAVDFIEKPFSDEELLEAIEAALTGIGRLDSDREASEAAERLAVLSPRERAVLDALVAGGQNKIIAFDLGISVRTVEAHRARMMHRLGVRRLAEAIRLVILAGSASSGESRRRTVTE
jgi:FixJ family two-component response regulator/signal transduction histidine kinase